MSPLLACLLPARNASTDLPGWFASVETFADVVIALDDGSTDDTGELLRSHPSTVVVLENPVRPTYEGWDDAANRNRLLDAAAAVRPTWIMQLDADERITPDDGAALRRALERGVADPDDGYLFQVLRMIGDDGAYDEDALWVGRLFAWRPEARFPDEALHFVALPTDVPRTCRRRTTVRIQHHGAATESKRQARYAKYAEADPERRYQDSYERLVTPPTNVRPWRPRAPELPFVAHTAAEPVARDLARPRISAVVIAQDDEATIDRTLTRLEQQETVHPFEIIVVTSGSDGTARLVDDHHPGLVHVALLDRRATPGAARNAGLARARGDYVCFPGSHVEVGDGYLQALVERHQEGWAMVTPSFAPGHRTRSAWANHFLDHSAKLPSRPPGPMQVEPSTASYLRAVLDWAGGFGDVRAGEDSDMNRTLFRAGYGAYLEPRARLVHYTPGDRPSSLVRHHIGRGAALGRAIADGHRRGELVTMRGLRRWGPRYVASRLLRIVRRIRAFGTPVDRRQLVRSLPLMLVAAVAHWCSGWVHGLRLLASDTGRRDARAGRGADRPGRGPQR